MAASLGFANIPGRDGRAQEATGPSTTDPDYVPGRTRRVIANRRGDGWHIRDFEGESRRPSESVDIQPSDYWGSRGASGLYWQMITATESETGTESSIFVTVGDDGSVDVERIDDERRSVDEFGNPLDEDGNPLDENGNLIMDFSDPASQEAEIAWQLAMLAELEKAAQAEPATGLTTPVPGGDGKGGGQPSGTGSKPGGGSNNDNDNDNNSDDGGGSNNDNNSDDGENENTNTDQETADDTNQNENEGDDTGDSGQPTGGRETGAGPYGGQSPAGQLRGAIKVDPGGRRLPESRDFELDTEDPDRTRPDPKARPGPTEPGAAASDSEGSGVPGSGITGEGTGLGSRGQGPIGKKPPKPTVNPAPDDQDTEAPDLGTRQGQQSPLRIPRPEDDPSIGQQQ